MGHKAKPMPPAIAEDHEPKAWPEHEKAAWFKRLCIWITEGGSLRSFVLKHQDGPRHSTWFDWLAESPIMADQYTLARERSADTLAEDCLLIADEVKDAGHMDSARVNAARLRVDARKWVASKLKPKTYADRLETVQSGTLTVTHSVSDEDRARVLALLMARETVSGSSSLVDAQRRIASHSKMIDVSPQLDAEKTSKDGPKSA